MTKECKNCIHENVCGLWIVEESCKHYQPKLSEDSIIVLKEEWKENHDLAFMSGKKEGIKETAEKYIKWLKENILSWGICGNGKISGKISITLKELEEFSKQFGDFAKLFSVEVKGEQQ